MNILDTIDNAIDDCAVSPDAMRWTSAPARQARAPRIRGFTINQVFIDEISHWLSRWVTTINNIAEQLQAAGMIPPPPPADPMQRAIEAKRNRNTGPKPLQRAPRRIDARAAYRGGKR